MAKAPKLAVLDVADIPLREVSGLVLHGSEILAVGDRDPVVFSAPLEPWPPCWQALTLPASTCRKGVQFEAVVPTGERTVLVLQEQPARVLQLELSPPALTGSLVLTSRRALPA